MAMKLGDDDHEEEEAAGGGIPQPSTDFRKAGAIPFKWEIQPGIPKPTYDKTHQHDQTLAPLISSSDHTILPLKHDEQAPPQKSLIPAPLRPPPSDQRANYQPHDQLGLITPKPKLSSSCSSSTAGDNYSAAPNSRRHRWSNSRLSTDHPPMPPDHLRMSSRVVSLRICLPTFRSFRKRLGFFTSIGRLNSSSSSSRSSSTSTTTPSTVISKATFETVSEIGSPVLQVNTLCSSISPVPVTPKTMIFLQQAQEQQPPIGRCSSSISTSHGRRDLQECSDHHPRMLGYDLPSRPFSSFREIISAPAAFDDEEDQEEAADRSSNFSINYRNSNRRIRNDLEWAAYGLF